MYIHPHMHMHTYVSVHHHAPGRSEGNLKETLLSFYDVEPVMLNSGLHAWQQVPSGILVTETSTQPITDMSLPGRELSNFAGFI